MSVMTLTGAPYHVGDFLLVQNGEGNFVEAEVLTVQSAPAPHRFGLRWLIEAEPMGRQGTTLVRVDDDGYNHNTGHRVQPSGRIVP